MTISKTGNKNQYSGDGTTTAFAFQYRFFDDTDLGVYVLASGVETKQTLTTHYTVSNTGTEDGGTVTFVTAPASGTTVTIIGEIPETQTADYEANDPFPAETHEAALDRGVRLIQQQQEAIGRALIAPVSDTASLELPLDRASKFLGFDASKNPVALSGTTGVAVSAFVEPALSSADAAAFQAAIDIDQGITFTPRTGVSHAEGLLYYDDDRKSLTFFNDDADVALNVGQEEWVFARNTTGSTITNGQAVYVSGASGNKPLIGLADADTEAESRLIGLATHDIENNSNGFVCVAGEVRNVDTSAFSAGDILYLSTTAGGVTATLPGDGKFNHIVGVVLNNHATQGIILVAPQCVGHTLAQGVWNTGTSTQEAEISPAKLEAKIDAKIAAAETIIAAGVFDGTGTPAWTFRAGFGATITDNGTGDYTVAFDSAEADTNYVVQVTAESLGAGVSNRQFIFAHTLTTSGFSVRITDVNGGALDRDGIHLTVHRLTWA